MSHNLKDLDRRPLNFNVSDVISLMPEHHQSEYGVDSGSLTKLLELYYDFLDSSGANSFKSEITNVFAGRDVTQTDESYLNELLGEIGNGVEQSSFFQNPRLMARLIPLFYKSKGSKTATEGFFRGFFGEEIEIEYPKNQLLFVGGKDPSGLQGQIGFDNQFRVIDNAVFQIFSILIRSGLSIDKYSSLYTRFAHPAGFNFQGELQTDQDGVITFVAQGINPLESAGGNIVVLDQATQTLVSGIENLTLRFDSSATGDPNISGVIPVDPVQNRFARFIFGDSTEAYVAAKTDQSMTLDQLENIYGDLASLLSPNSFTFDNNRRRRAFDVISDNISFSQTSGNIGGTGPNAGMPTLRTVGMIQDWNSHLGTADSNFSLHFNMSGSSSRGTGMGTSDSSGFISKTTNVLVTTSANHTAQDSGEIYRRIYTTKEPVDLTNEHKLIFWTNRGGNNGTITWGNDPQNNEDLQFQFSKTLSTNPDSAGVLANPSTFKTILANTAPNNAWRRHEIIINGLADSNVYLQFKHVGTQFGNGKDNWAFTSVYIDSAYDSAGPDMSLKSETMDNDLFTRRLSDSAI